MYLFHLKRTSKSDQVRELNRKIEKVKKSVELSQYSYEVTHQLDGVGGSNDHPVQKTVWFTLNPLYCSSERWALVFRRGMCQGK